MTAHMVNPIGAFPDRGRLGHLVRIEQEQEERLRKSFVWFNG